MKNLKTLVQLLIVFLFLTGCKNLVNKEVPIIDSKEKQEDKSNIIKNKMEVRFSCGENGISEFIDDGWIIVEEYSEEKICTWKSFPATKDCDMEKDKGCKITTPDKIGEEKIYLLEK